MRGEAQAVPPDAHEDAALGEDGAHPVGGVRPGVGRRGEHQVVRGLQRLRDGGEPELRRVRGQLRGQRPEGLGDVRRAPFHELAGGGEPRGDEGEVRPVAGVVAAGADLPGVGVLPQPGEVPGVLPLHPVVFQRLGVEPVGGRVEPAEGVGAEEPLVGGAGGEVRADPLQIDRQRPERLRQVHDQRGAHLPRPAADPLQVEDRAVGPTDLRKRDHRHPVVEMLQHRPGPVAVLRTGDEARLAPGAARPLGPGIDIRGELLRRQQHPAAGPHRERGGGEGEPVTGAGGERHLVGAGAEQRGPGGPERLAVVEEVVGADLPGTGLGAEAGLAGGDHGVHQRRQVGAVQEGDFARQVEAVPLVGQSHRRDGRPAARPGLPGSPGIPFFTRSPRPGAHSGAGRRPVRRGRSSPAPPPSGPNLWWGSRRRSRRGGPRSGRGSR